MIAVGFTTLVLVSLALAIRVIRSTSPERRRTPADLERWRRNENRYAVGVVIALIALLAATIFAVPYDDTSADNAQKVEVVAFQFGWSIRPSEIKAGEKAVFEASSRDVQHGFGIYKGTELIDQVQVPARRPESDAETGDTQRLVHTFDEPGTYQVLCLEFCGVNHQNMQASFEVVP